MPLIQFTENYDDLSTDRGYQFKFHCDKCGNGYLTSFQPNVAGIAGGLLRAAGDLLGGALGRAGDSAYEIQQAIGGPAHDDALRKAVEEARPHFKQCSRCGKCVCIENCWNASRGLCKDCAPETDEEVAAAQSQAARDQIWQKAAEQDQIKEVRMTPGAQVAVCPSCGAKTRGSNKFCPECGASLQAKLICSKCGNEAEPGTKFCPECGNKLT